MGLGLQKPKMRKRKKFDPLLKVGAQKCDPCLLGELSNSAVFMILQGDSSNSKHR